MSNIADKLQTLQNIKSDIKTSILNKGIEVGDDFTTYADAIDSIEGGVFVVPNGMKFKDSTISTIPDNFDFSEVTDASGIFNGCMYLEYIPEFTNSIIKCESMFQNCYRIKNVTTLNTISVSNFNYMYYMCQSVTDFPEIDTSNGLTFSNMYGNCYLLEYVPPLITEKATDITGMFTNCKILKVFPSIITSNVNKMGGLINNCKLLTSLPKLDCGNVTSTTPILDGNTETLTNLTDLGGFENLKVSWGNYFLSRTPNLTVDSLMNVINGLWDWTDYPDGKAPLNNGTIYSFGTTHKLKFGQTNLDKLSDEQIAVATAKGWTLTA